MIENVLKKTIQNENIDDDQLCKKTGIYKYMIQRVRSGQTKIQNLTLKNYIKLQDFYNKSNNKNEDIIKIIKDVLISGKYKTNFLEMNAGINHQVPSKLRNGKKKICNLTIQSAMKCEFFYNWQNKNTL